MPAQWQRRRPVAQRLASFGLVIALHALVIALLVSQSATVQELVPAVLRVVQIVRPAAPPPPPPALTPQLTPPDLMPLPPPDIVIAQTPSPLAPRAITHAPSATSHFGPATDDAGLGIAVATRAGGGAGGRGSLGAFEAAVKRAVLARKSQPALAWDRRNTCIINYTVTVAPDGALAGFRIDPCAVPEINAAAKNAIRAAAPFPPPPDLGAARTDVHGTLIFHP